MSAAGLAVLLCPTLIALGGGADPDSLPRDDRQAPAQSALPALGGDTSADRPAAGGTLTRPAGGIVDLKPGDARVFAPSASTPGKLHRWAELQGASVAIQYLFATSGSGVTTANQPQYQIAARGRFKFDAAGRFSLNAGLSTGASFIAGFNNSGIGLGAAQGNVYLKHLYLSAQPLDGIEVQYGGLDIWHDESTDITGYGYSGYVVGERVSVKRPRELFFDDISIGYGYIDDLDAPDVFGRVHRLAQSNFHRFILRKDLGDRAWMSADYAYQSGVPTWREAARIRASELRVVDTIHVEVYEISRLNSGHGLAAYVEKMIHPQLFVGGGYADIDRPMLNSDRYGRGRRLFLTTRIPLTPAFSVLVFATQATNRAATNAPQHRLDIGLYYNVLDLLRKSRLF
jgi:hypothetical protein